MFTIAIAGRPNVGKSTLFNRLAGKRLALVDDQPGLTRDRREAEMRLGDGRVRIVDTAGLEEASAGSIADRMRAQSEAAIGEADLILFVIDARVGVTPSDERFAEVIRRTNRPVIVIANKAEGQKGTSGFYEAFALGLGEPVAVSAEHGDGIGELLAQLAVYVEEAGYHSVPATENEETNAAAEKALKIAIIGRPNVGKSTLVNYLLGEDRMITGPEAGLTRDAIASDLLWQGRAVRLFDTAGLRKKSRISQKAEQLSVGDALRAIRFAEVVVLLLDAQCPFEKQDLALADLVVEEGRALVIGVNKWDLVDHKQAMLKSLKEKAERLLPQIRGVPLVTLSAEQGSGARRLMKAVFDLETLWNSRVPTAKLNAFLADMEARHTPPAVKGRPIRLRYMTQVSSRPPTFVLFCSRPKELPVSYQRYLINGLREAFNLPGVPIRLHLRKPHNPYV